MTTASEGINAPEVIEPEIPTERTLELSAKLRTLRPEERQILVGGISGVVDISAAPLQGMLMSDLKLRGAKLTQVCLACSDLTAGDLRGIQGMQLSGVCGTFRAVNFSGADLRDALFTGADLTDAKFVGANLTNAILTGANVKGALFISAVLKGATLTGLQNWRDAVWSYAVLDGAIIPPEMKEFISAKAMLQ